MPMLILLGILFYGTIFCLMGIGYAFWRARVEDNKKQKNKKRHSTRRSTLIKDD